MAAHSSAPSPLLGRKYPVNQARSGKPPGRGSKHCGMTCAPPGAPTSVAPERQGALTPVNPSRGRPRVRFPRSKSTKREPLHSARQVEERSATSRMWLRWIRQEIGEPVSPTRKSSGAAAARRSQWQWEAELTGQEPNPCGELSFESTSAMARKSFREDFRGGSSSEIQTGQRSRASTERCRFRGRHPPEC